MKRKLYVIQDGYSEGRLKMCYIMLSVVGLKELDQVIRVCTHTTPHTKQYHAMTCRGLKLDSLQSSIFYS